MGIAGSESHLPEPDRRPARLSDRATSAKTIEQPPAKALERPLARTLELPPGADRLLLEGEERIFLERECQLFLKRECRLLLMRRRSVDAEGRAQCRRNCLRQDPSIHLTWLSVYAGADASLFGGRGRSHCRPRSLALQAAVARIAGSGRSRCRPRSLAWLVVPDVASGPQRRPLRLPCVADHAPHSSPGSQLGQRLMNAATDQLDAAIDLLYAETDPLSAATDQLNAATDPLNAEIDLLNAASQRSLCVSGWRVKPMRPERVGVETSARVGAATSARVRLDSPARAGLDSSTRVELVKDVSIELAKDVCIELVKDVSIELVCLGLQRRGKWPGVVVLLLGGGAVLLEEGEGRSLEWGRDAPLSGSGTGRAVILLKGIQGDQDDDVEGLRASVEDEGGC
ncbi:hypothetical protein EV714DRAFT_273207 [Schizophyllum commune]